MDNLTREQAETALRYLLHRMPMDTRRAMMADLPTVYAALFPSVENKTIVAAVRVRLAENR